MADKDPVVGMGASLVYPSDIYPYVVVRVVSDKVIDVARLRHDHLKPNGDHNGFPVYSAVIDPADYAIAAGWEKSPERARKHKDGRWYLGGSSPLSIGYAKYRRDWSD